MGLLGPLGRIGRRKLSSLMSMACAAAIVGASCSSDAATTAQPCAEVERLVASSSLHVLPGADLVFEHSPPAGGAHQLPAPEPGVYQEALAPALQVAILEAGGVIVQYQPHTPPSDIEALEALATNPLVVVMPGAQPFDDDALVAFTSWGRRQLCSVASPTQASEFVERFAGAIGPAHD